jgi:hypothetical protein
LEFSVKDYSIKLILINKNLFLFSHDEWIKLDRVIERKDSTNANTLFQQRPRRTSQINTLRQQHLDSTNSNEQNNQQQQQITNLLIDDYDEQNKLSKSISIERNKIEESDIDDNSQGQSESNSIFFFVFFKSFYFIFFMNNSLESC